MDERVNGGVVVDAGHGGSDPGAISGNLKEKRLKRLKDEGNETVTNGDKITS